MSRRAASVPLWAWALLIALLPILLRMIDGFLALPVGGEKLVGVHDPDSWLRLTLVRDWLLGGSWYDHSYASNAPFDHAVSPWTRPLDIVIAFFTKLQFTDAPLELKLIRTALLLPLVWMVLLISALFYAVRRLTTMPHAIFMLSVLLVTAPIIYNYFGPANADHHAFLAALFAWVAALMVTADPKLGRTQWLIGALLALMLWISPEALLPIAIIYGWFGLTWLAGGSIRPLARLATFTAIFVAIAIGIERPFDQWFVPIYDSISISQLLPLALVALITWPLTRITSFFWLWRALATALMLAVVMLIIYKLDPLFFAGPMALVDDYIKTDFLPRITEARHATDGPMLKLLGLLLQPVLAILIALRCSTNRNGILAPRHSAALLYLILATLILYLGQIRWSYYLYPVVALTLAPWLASWMNPQHKTVASYWPANKLRRFTEKQLVARRLPLLLFVLAMPILLILLATSREQNAEDTVSCSKDMRRLLQSGEIENLGNGKPLTIFAATDIGGELLFFTHHRIIASNYHREGPGIRDMWQTQQSKKLSDVQALVEKRKIDALMICPDPTTPEDSALHRLRKATLKAPFLTPYRLQTKDLSDDPPAIFLVKSSAR